MKRYILTTIISFLACLGAWSQSPCLTTTSFGSARADSVGVEMGPNGLTLGFALRLDSIDLPANTQLVCTPWVTSGDHAVRMPEIVVNGRRQQIMYDRGYFDGKYSDRAYIVKRNNGTEQTVRYYATVDYEPWMSNYSIRLHQDVCGCGDSIEAGDSRIYHHFKPQMAFVKPAAQGIKEGHIDKTSYIDFPVDKITLYPNYRRNPIELDSIVNTILLAKRDSNIVIRKIDIHGFASPESPYSHNAYLAENRAKALKDYVRQLVDLPDETFTVSYTPENWSGLIDYVKQSNQTHRDEILALCADESIEPDAREKKIKELYPDEYQFMLATWYPALRRSDYHIYYIVKPFTAEQARQLIKTKPQQLSLEEMFMAAQTYEAGSDEFNEVMEVAVRMYPNDTVANLNAACTRLNMGDTEGAKPYLDKAGNTGEAIHARAVLALLEGRNADARQLFEQAKEAGIEAAEENLKEMQ